MARTMPRLARRGREKPVFELSDNQGNVLRGYTYPCAAYLFLRIDDVAKARELMKRMLKVVASAEEWTDGPPDTALTVALTYSGLAVFGLPEEMVATLIYTLCDGDALPA